MSAIPRAPVHRSGPPPPPPPSRPPHPLPAPAPNDAPPGLPSQIQPLPESHDVVAPPGAVLEPMSRPGYGTRGRPIGNVSVNTFQVAIAETDQYWWKYEVVIATAARVKPDGTPVPPKPLPKSLLWKVWMELETTHAARFNGLKPGFDGRSAVYTNRQLPASPLVIEGISIPDGKRGTFTATFQKPIGIPLEGIRSYISGEGQAHIGDVNEALQALNVLFRHTPSLLYPSTGTNFYPMDDMRTSVSLPHSIQLWRGFFQSIRPCQRGLQLNLDTTSGAYVRSGNLLDLVLQFANLRDPQQLDVERGRLQPVTVLAINRLLRKVRVTIDRGQLAPAGKERWAKLELKGSGLKLMSARNHTFEADGRITSVMEFFRTAYGTRLQYPDLPLVEVKKGVLIPMELVSVDPGNKWNHRLSPDQQNLASKFQILEPGDRLRQILRMRQTVLQQKTQAHLDKFGVNLALEVTQVPARVLTPPMIEYSGDRPRDRRPGAPPRFVSARVTDGAWKQSKRGPNVDEKLITPNKELRSAVIILPKSDMMRDTPQFFQEFFKWCGALGLLVSPEVSKSHEGLFFVKNNYEVSTVVANALKHGENVFRATPQVVFWLFESENSEDYDKFKFDTVRRGIASQALVAKKLAGKMRDFTFHLNLAFKLNVKLSGFNFRLEYAPPGRGNFMQVETPMLFGADLSHQSDKPSIAVVTATMHDRGVLYEEQIAIQPLVEPGPGAPPTARAKKQEIIVDLEQMVFDLLVRRVHSISRCPPRSIVFLRDGVSEAEIAQVLQTEVAATRKAFDRFRTTLLDRKSAEHQDFVESVKGVAGRSDQDKEARIRQFVVDLEGWMPKLTFILTIKRHHLRAFVSTGPQSAQNILPGTVIDSHVVDARAFDFYLAAQKGIKGTTRPTRYLVLTDDNNLTADDVQEFVYDCSHTYQRCTRAVSLPSPVYYADLIGRRVRGWLNAGNNYDGSTTTGESSFPTAESRRADLEACRLTLEETIAGRNAFRSQRGPPSMWWL